MDNSIILTTLVLSLVGIIVLNVKAIFSFIYNQFINLFLFSMKIEESSPFFYAVQKYILNEKNNKIKNFYYRNIYDNYISGEDKWFNLFYNYGLMFIKHEGKFILLYKSTDKIQNSHTPYKNEKHTLMMFSFSKKSIMGLVTYIEKTYSNNTLKYYFNSDGDIKLLGNIPNKTFKNIYLNNDINKKIVNDLNKFLKSEKLYRDLGIKYKRTYCFFGEAGTGKSSLIVAIANHTNRDILSVNLSKDMSDSTLIKLIASRTKNSIIAFEDIDCLFDDINRQIPETEKKNKISLSCILNILDGTYTPENVIFVLTTNHIDKLDQAITRDGRTDVLFPITKPNIETKKQYIEYLKTKGNFNKNLDEYLDKDVTLSTIQNEILNYDENV